MIKTAFRTNLFRHVPEQTQTKVIDEKTCYEI